MALASRAGVPLWRSIRGRRIFAQIVFGVLLAAGLYYLWYNLVSNMLGRGISTSFGFLERPAGFRISGSDFRPTQRVLDALAVGVKNTLVVALVGVALATVLGVFVGIARLSSNWLVRRAASTYVETLRNVPVLVVIIFFSAAVILKLPRIDDPIEWPGLVLSRRGMWVPWPHARAGLGAFWLVLVAAVLVTALVVWWRTRRADATGRPHHRVAWGSATFLVIAGVGYVALGQPVGVTFPERTARAVAGGTAVGPEYAALLAGLVIYTASHIAEIVRGSILSVAKGQTEAATAIGLSPGQRLRLVILPQAFRVAIPPLANQYLNLTKNSSLAIVVGYPELMTVTRIVIGNGNPAPQAIAILMAIYLTISLAIAAMSNLVNTRLRAQGLR